MNKQPSQKQLNDLYELCREFIKHHEIEIPEDIIENSYILENADNLIESMCDIIGYEDNIND